MPQSPSESLLWAELLKPRPEVFGQSPNEAEPHNTDRASKPANEPDDREEEEAA